MLSQAVRGRYKRPLTSQNFIGLWKEKRYRRNMMFLFAGHSAGLLSKNFVKQRLHENFRIPAPWLTKEIIFVCTVFLSFTLWMTCERTLIHAQFMLWTAPQNLPIYVMGWVPILGSAARILDWRILLTQFQDYFILSLHQSRRQITVTIMKHS